MTTSHTGGIRTFPNGDLGTWIRWLSQVVLIPVVAYMLFATVTHDKRLAMIESNRFTSSDASKLQIILQQKDAELLQIINDIRRDGAVRNERIEVIRTELAEIRKEIGG